MIKEKKKKTKYDYKKTKKQIIVDYIKTITASLIFATIVTSSLAINARNEMLKDISTASEVEEHLDKQLALQLVTQNDFIKDLGSKKYSVCLHIGDLYEAAGDYKDAQLAYEYAVQKSKPNIYTAHYKLLCVLIAQGDFENAEALLDNIKDYTDTKLIKFKTRSYIIIGDKYYSIGKFLSAAKSYEQAKFYYDKFSRKDKIIEKSIKNRIVNSYIQTSDVMVKTGMNSDAVRFLKKAENLDKENYKIRYKLAIVFSDLDPEKSVEYLEELLTEIPQEIDYGIYGRALMKAAHIADLDNRPTKAKYYRYKIHSIDLFVNRKVVFQNDIEVALKSFSVKKVFFTYPLKATYEFLNNSNNDIINLKGDFVLTNGEKVLETITKTISNKNKPLISNGYEPNLIDVKFNKKVYTKKELENYTVKIYLYKDEKYKTLVSENRIPATSIDYKD